MGNPHKEEEITPTNIIQRNAAANFVGRSWNAAMSLVFVPVYIKLMGAEAYGLVGFLVSLQMILSLLEMGLSTTTTKELARLSSIDHRQSERDMADLMRTLELVYLLIALLAGFVILLGSQILAVKWFNPQTLSVREIRYVIIIMGWLIAARMPFSLYSGALVGLQKQVLLNTIIVILVTIKHLGAVLVLIFISSDVTVFFIWNLTVEAFQTAAAGFYFWRNLKTPSYKAGFKVEQIKKIWRFATGMSIIGATNVILSQADKLFVSKMFSLETFGYYSAVWTLAGALFFLTYPIVTALFPRYAQLIGNNEKFELVRLYRQSSSALSAILLPFGITFLIFSEQIISIWLPMVSDPKLIANVFRVLVFAVILNSFFNLPMNLQLASGWTSLMIITNAVWVIVMPLLIFWLVSVMGLPGAPMGWLLYNLFCFAIVAHLAHRKIFGDGMRIHFYIHDIGVPFLGAFFVIGICFLLFPMPAGVIGKCAILVSVVMLGGIASVLTIKDVRSKALQLLRYGQNYAKYRGLMETQIEESYRSDILESVCVFVSSSDNTKDVFFQVSRCFEKHWSNCPFPIYVGLNTQEEHLPPRFEAVFADISQWHSELISQLNQLPKQIRFILLFLDDFLVESPVDTDRVVSIITQAAENNIRYMRFIPQSRAMLPSLGKKLNHIFQPAEFEELKADAPYYASLQIALWEKDHLINMLKNISDIWNFEHSYIPGVKHHAIVDAPPIRYQHVVEKGKWQSHAASMFEQAGLAFDPSTRQMHSFRHRFTLWINKLKFAFLGYSIFKLRRRQENSGISAGDTP